MHSFKSVLVSFVFVASVINALTSALECYECFGDTTGPCGDPFDKDSVSTCTKDTLKPALDAGVCLKAINEDIGN